MAASGSTTQPLSVDTPTIAGRRAWEKHACGLKACNAEVERL